MNGTERDAMRTKTRPRLVWLAVVISLLCLALPAQATQAEPPDTLRLSLAGAVGRALAQSEEIAAARAQLFVADAQVTQATAGAWPQLSAVLTYNRAIRTIFDEMAGPPPAPDSLIPDAFDTSKTPEERYDLLNELMTQDFLSSLFTGLPFGRRNTYIATFQLAQPLYAGGRISGARAVARHFHSAARDWLEEAKAEITLQVRTAYLNAVLARRLHAIALDSRRVAEAHFQQVESFHEAGTASDFDLLRARVDLENRDPAVIQAENAAELALLELKRLVNVPADEPVALITEFEPDRVEINEDELTRLVFDRPILHAARATVAMREQGVRIARGNWLPSLQLLGNLGFQAFPDDPVPPGWGNWRSDWNVALSVAWTPFDGFRTRGRVDEARAQLTVARVEEAQLREGLQVELSAALAEYRAARAQIRARRETVVMAEEALALADIRFASGLSTQLEVSDAALLLDQARLNEVQALFDYVRALASLERLTGGRLALLTEARDPS
ncbi:MAG: TolC family protein [Gemmatimonadota bacterium]|nr:MAG: TolC family protein [Gemmatimonadota bacterium]